MAETRTYDFRYNITLAELAGEVESFLRDKKKLDTQVIAGDNRYIVQSKGDSTPWIKFFGMDAATTVDMRVDSGILTVTIGDAKWIDKLGAATVGMLFAPVLFITAGLGTIRQGMLPGRVFEVIEAKLAGRKVRYNSVHFCHHCGADLSGTEAYCPKCGTSIRS